MNLLRKGFFDLFNAYIKTSNLYKLDMAIRLNCALPEAAESMKGHFHCLRLLTEASQQDGIHPIWWMP